RPQPGPLQPGAGGTGRGDGRRAGRHAPAGRAPRGAGRLHREAQPARPRPADLPVRRGGHHPVRRRPGRPVGRGGLQGPGEDPAGPVRVCHPDPGAGGTRMNRPLDDFAELHTLLDALCEEVITAEQARRLEELILTRPEVEAYYVQYMSLHADLASHFGALPAQTEQSLRDRLGGGQAARPAVIRLRFPVRPRFFVAIAAVAAALLLAVALWPRP